MMLNSRSCNRPKRSETLCVGVAIVAFAMIFTVGCSEQPTASKPIASSPPPAPPAAPVKIDGEPQSAAQKSMGGLIDPRLLKAFPKIPKPVDPGKPIRIAYKPVLNSVWRYKLTNELKQDQMGAESSVKTEMDLAFEQNAITADAFQVHSRLENTIWQLDTPAGGMIVDTWNPSRQKMDPPFKYLGDIWSAVIEAEATYSVTTDGKIEDFEAPPEIMDAFHENALGKEFGVSADAYVGQLKIAVFQLPSEPVSVGDTWPFKSRAETIAVEESSDVATFLGVIEVRGKKYAMMEYRAKADKPMDNKMVVDHNMDSVSVVVFDLEAGNVWRVHTVSDMVTTLAINKMDLEQFSHTVQYIRRLD